MTTAPSARLPITLVRHRQQHARPSGVRLVHLCRLHEPYRAVEEPSAEGDIGDRAGPLSSRSRLLGAGRAAIEPAPAGRNRLLPTRSPARTCVRGPRRANHRLVLADQLRITPGRRGGGSV